MSTEDFVDKQDRVKLSAGHIKKFSILFQDVTSILFPFEHPLSDRTLNLNAYELERREQMMRQLNSQISNGEEFEKAKQVTIEFIKKLNSLEGKLLTDLPVNEFDKLLGMLSRAATHISQAFSGIPREEWSKFIPGRKLDNK